MNSRRTDLVVVDVQAFTATTTAHYQQKRKIRIPLLSSSTSSSSDFLSSSKNENNASDAVRQQKPQQQQQQGLSNQQGKREMINSILAQPPTYSSVEDTSLVTINNNIVPILDDTTVDLLNCIVAAADGRKADNIVALYIAHMTTMTSLLVVVSGNSRPQNQAICSAIRTAVSDLNKQQQLETMTDTDDDQSTSNYYSQPGIEGTAESGWMILDYGSIMVHVMTPKSRLFYNVEGKWKQPLPMISTATSGSIAATTSVAMATAISLDLSHLLVPNTAATFTTSSDDGFGTTYQNVVQEEEVENEGEEELDPFWT